MSSSRRNRVSPSGVPTSCGPDCPTGGTGVTGPCDVECPTGPTGPAGVSDFANFFALMPGDNADTVAPGTPVDFPQDGPSSGAVIRTDASTFQVLQAGVYSLAWQVSVDEAGQLVIAVDSGAGFVEQAETVVGRATGTNQIVGDTLLALAENDLVQVWNPTGNAVALTITPIAGGTHPVSATLTFIRLS